MNKVSIIGNLTRDPETRTLENGSTVCSFTVAVTRRKKVNDHPVADYFRVSAWNKLGEVCQNYLVKGRKVYVDGQISVSTYEAKDGTTRASLDVMANDVEFLSPRDAANGGNESPENAVDETDSPF